MPLTRARASLQSHKVPQRRLMLGVAAVVGMSLMAAYVQLLHGSVARGDVLRADQRSAAADRKVGAWQTAERSTARSFATAVSK